MRLKLYSVYKDKLQLQLQLQSQKVISPPNSNHKKSLPHQIPIIKSHLPTKFQFYVWEGKGARGGARTFYDWNLVGK